MIYGDDRGCVRNQGFVGDCAALLVRRYEIALGFCKLLRLRPQRQKVSNRQKIRYDGETIGEIRELALQCSPKVQPWPFHDTDETFCKIAIETVAPAPGKDKCGGR